MNAVKIPVVTGPTACGKTSFAVALSARIDGEIISVDSRQLYRGLDIGSGKDLAEYTLPDGTAVPCHLIDIADPNRPYNLAEFMRDCHAAVAEIHARGKVPVLAGGTALYLDSILRSYSLTGGAPDPEGRETLRSCPTEELREQLRRLEPDSEILRKEPDNRPRIIRRIEMLECPPDLPLLEKANKPGAQYEFLVLGILRSRAELHQRIEVRLDARLKEGMLDEAVRLHEQGVSWERMEFFGLEYRYMALHLQGKMSLQEMRDTLLARIRQFAKRQDSWFRYMERKGVDIHWFRPDQFEEALETVRKFLRGKPVEKPAFRLSETFYGPRQN